MTDPVHYSTVAPYKYQYSKGDPINPEIYLTYTGRIFGCVKCSNRTGWRDTSADCEVPICSVDCRMQLAEDLIEVNTNVGNAQTGG